jgi:hypothetical protein
MIDLDWLQDRLCECLRYQYGNPGSKDGPEVPWAGLRVWGIFLKMNDQRGTSFGPCPISYRDMIAFARISGEAIRPWEAEIIRALDREYLTLAAGPKSGYVMVSARPMSPALFDGLFSGGG